MYRPETEGIDHINMYSKSTIPYGRMLSNFHEFPIMTKDGEFKSVEGYWWWLSIEECPEREALRYLHGYKAVQTGKELLGEHLRAMVPDFEHRIQLAIWYKMRRNHNLYKTEYDNLPIVHYYVYGDKIIDKTLTYKWLMDSVNKMRDSLVADPSLWKGV